MRPGLPVRPQRRSIVAIGFVAALVLAVAAPAPAIGATAGDQLWVARYNGPVTGYNSASAVAVSPDGTTVFVTGSSERTAGGDYDYATVAYDAVTGATVWARRYNGAANGVDYANALAVSPDGSTLYVTGASEGSASQLDYATVAYDAATGVRVWVRRYNGPAGGSDQAEKVLVSPDGARVFVTGISEGSGTAFDYLTVAYDAVTGAKVWLRRYDGPGNGDDIANALAVSPDGAAVYVTGRSVGSKTSDYATVAYDAGTGATNWIRRYNGPGYGFDEARDLAVSPDGATVYVTCQSHGTRLYDYATLAYDAATGQRAWVRRTSGPANDYDTADALGVSPDGTLVFVTGGTFSAGTGNYATYAYDAATGAKVWGRRYNGPANGDDVADALAVSPDGAAVYVTGYSHGVGTTSDSDYATVAYGARTGARIWVRRYNGPADDYDIARAIAVSPGSTAVYVTGGSAEGPLNLAGYGYATIAYGS